MTTQVTRHQVPADRVFDVQKLVDDTEARVSRLETMPSTFNMALNRALANAKSDCALDPEADRIETWEAWVAAMQIGSALFRSATSTEPTVECLISGKTRTLRSTGPHSPANAGNWLTAFYLALGAAKAIGWRN